MPNTTENLGKVSAWQIREFPEGLRDAITEQARKENVKVGELLTRLVLEANAAGWSFAGKVDGFANQSNVSLERARVVSELLGNMGAAGIPPQKRVATAANRLAMELLRGEGQGGVRRGPVVGGSDLRLGADRGS